MDRTPAGIPEIKQASNQSNDPELRCHSFVLHVCFLLRLTIEFVDRLYFGHTIQ